MFKKQAAPLPPGKYRMGGAHFKNDKAFVRTAVRDVRRLVKYCDLGVESSLLDWGCGGADQRCRTVGSANFKERTDGQSGSHGGDPEQREICGSGGDLGPVRGESKQCRVCTGRVSGANLIGRPR